MAHFGLRRGVVNSGRKYEPIPVYLARLAATGRELDAARTAIDRQATRLKHDAGDLEKAKAEHAARVNADDRRLAADRDALRRQQIQAVEARTQALREIALQRKERNAASRARASAEKAEAAAQEDRTAAAASRKDAQAMYDRIKAHRAQLGAVFRAGEEFARRLKRVEHQPLSIAASTARAGMDAFYREAAAVRPPQGEVRAEVLQAYELIKQQAIMMRGGGRH
jgi:colicin import membrane protein